MYDGENIRVEPHVDEEVREVHDDDDSGGEEQHSNNDDVEDNDVPLSGGIRQSLMHY